MRRSSHKAPHPNCVFRLSCLAYAASQQSNFFHQNISTHRTLPVFWSSHPPGYRAVEKKAPSKERTVYLNDTQPPGGNRREPPASLGVFLAQKIPSATGKYHPLRVSIFRFASSASWLHPCTCDYPTRVTPSLSSLISCVTPGGSSTPCQGRSSRPARLVTARGCAAPARTGAPGPTSLC